jgi:three-Cys-motif partner protein
VEVNLLKFDQIGYWSEIKLEIIKEYAAAYSRILSARTQPSLYHIYIDAFAGAGIHLARQTKERVPGSPLNALSVQPPFREYHFIDLDGGKVAFLKTAVGDRQDVHFYEGDCNVKLLEEVYPKAKYADYRRALCLLDPYGLHLKWSVIEMAARMKSVEIFLNFPVADMNRHVFWHNPQGVDEADIQRMNEFWGDDSWKNVAYTTIRTLFGPTDEKAHVEEVSKAFERRLQQVAGFEYVANPIPMRNTKGVILYYLFFASPNPVAKKIVDAIFDKYRGRTG